MSEAKIVIDGEEYEFPVVEGSEGEIGVDTTSLRKKSGAISLDPGFGSTGSCTSAITFINGEEGVLRYRGYPIEQLAEKTSYEEVAHLVIYGHLPNASELETFRGRLDEAAYLPERFRSFLSTFHRDAHPMGILSSAVSALSGFHQTDDVEQDIINLVAKFKTLAAFIYRYLRDEPFVYPKRGLSYAGDFLQMMYGRPGEPYEIDEDVEAMLDKLLILHVDHEQNCSASTCRMVGSSGANLYASISAGVGALWGPLHGGANQRVLEMLQTIRDDDDRDVSKYIELAKDKDSDFRLMGFGHRVYKNYDPRAKIIKKSANDVLDKLGVDDPLLDIARELEQTALEDDYFAERRLYPNVDFYSGIIYRALGIPTNMFTVMFALGRVSGWISQWKELRDDKSRIWRPRQVYIGENERQVTPLDER